MGPIRILVVEDDETTAQNLRLLLEQYGYRVEGPARTGPEAVSLALALHPDLILMDIVLDGAMDGIEAAQHILEKHDIPIIYLTAHVNDDLLMRARITGPFGYLIKPCTPRELHATIYLALYKAETDRKLKDKSLACDSFAAIADAVITLDEAGCLALHNEAAARLFRAGTADVIGKHWDAVIAPQDGAGQTAIAELIRHTAASAAVVRHGDLVNLLDRDGIPVPIMLRASPVFNMDRAVTGVAVMFVDVADLHNKEQALLRSERRFRDVVEAAGEYVWECDAQWNYSYISHRATEIFGYSDADFVGQPLFRHEISSEPIALEARLHDYAASHLPFRGVDFQAITKWGRAIWLQINGLPMLDELGHLIGYRGTGSEITERKQTEKHIEYLATRDPLTGLPNRTLLHDRLQHHIANAQREQRKLGILFMDLDNFKRINDSLGHAVGDEVLLQVTARMASCVRAGDTLARFGGDEFVAIIADVEKADQLMQLLRKLNSTIAQPYLAKGITLHTSSSIGVAMYPDHGTDPNTLLRNADAAMYQAKANGKSRHQFFNKELGDRAITVLELENALRSALRQGELVVFYQPKVNMLTGKITGVEALLRWQHPDQGLLLPATFISLAEETGLIQEIGEWVLQQACEQSQTWTRSGYGTLQMSVNLSIAQLNSQLARTVKSVLTNTGMDGRHLELEVTESIMTSAIQSSIDALRALRHMDIKISMDDFGTGYSSLSNLRHFPLDILKIDQSFVRDLELDISGSAIIKAIVGIAKSLGLSVIAEGVETQQQLHLLRDAQCFEYQGYLFGEPVAPDHFEARFLKREDARL